MNARTSWGARKDRRSVDEGSSAAGQGVDLPLDDLLEARFDAEGRLAQIGRGNRQRVAERLDSRPPAMDADELERAVQKLAQGLQAIERESSVRRPRPARPAPRDEAANPEHGEARGPDFVTYSLDRLEARLEALSERLQKRSVAAPSEPDKAPPAGPAAEVTAASAPAAAISMPASPAPEAAVPDLGQADPVFAAEPPYDAEAEFAEALREAEADRMRREAEEAAAERDRAEMTEAHRRAEIAAVARAAAAAHAERLEAAAATEMKRQFGALEARIEALQQTCDENQIEPVRNELLDLLRQIENVGRDGRSIAGAVEQVRSKLDEMDTKLNGARNMAGNRLSELQDRLYDLSVRLVDMEAEVPGFDALRENQSAILERFDRMEGLVHRLASPEDLWERIDVLKRQLQNVASQHEVARIGEQILTLAERLESLPEDLSDRIALGRIEGQLQGLASEFAEAQSQRSSGAAELTQRLADFSASLRQIGEVDRAPDMSGLDQRLSEISSRLDDDRRLSADALARLDGRLAALAVAVDKEEDAAAAEILASLTHKMDALAETIDAQDARGTRRDLQGLDAKLDQLSHALTEQAERLSAPQMQPLEERLDKMQAHLEELARRSHASTAQFGPFAQKLQEISDRVGGLGAAGPSPLSVRLAAIEERLAAFGGKGPDPRAVHNQLEGIVSRLELLKGRSIDPVRLAELFDRVDAAMRMGLVEERFDRIEKKIDASGVPVARFDRLEKRIAEGTGAALSDERFAWLEEKLDSIGRAYAAAGEAVDGELLTQEDLAELRNDIVALRRELRSLPGLGDGEASLGTVLKTISARLERMSEDAPATALDLETQIDRIAELLDDPTHSRLALAHIETSLRTIEERLEETRQTMLFRSGGEMGVDAGQGDIDTVAGLARVLSDDVTVLKGASEASERKTRDALEAVQDTLQAVVKRMAFLERDADIAAASQEERYPPVQPAIVVQPVLAAPALAELPPAPAVAEMPGLTREATSGGLFSRFTSSQLLKRATGGRAESFSPDLDEGEDVADLPLEPGTDAPLTSALSGAPSSDTALMSGARARSRTPSVGRSSGLEADDAHRAMSAPLAGDDFLAAARRAAQAAAAEVADAEREAREAREAGGLSRLLSIVKGRRRAILAAALVVAVAFAALQVLRNRMGEDEIEVAALPATTAMVEDLSTAAPASEPIFAEPDLAVGRLEARDTEVPAAAMPMPSNPPPMPADAAGLRQEESDTVRSAGDAAAPASPASPASIASLGGTASEPGLNADDAPTLEPGLNADDAPTTEREPVIAPMPAPPTQPAAELPEAIGSERLRDAAMAGDEVAAFEVAARYAEGRGLPADLPAAVSWYERAAHAGLAPAQYRLGSIYEKGLGVPQDLALAQEWYRRATDAGNVKAMHNLAVLNAEGAGGEPDLEAAAALFRQAAEHGVRDSQFNLAILHARGLGVPQDMLEAYKWFAVAASSGDAESVKRRDIIAAALSASDLAKAQAAAAGFQPLPLIAEANDVMMPEGGWGEDSTSVELESENEMVALVQGLLAEKGFDPGPADGMLGAQTIQAITAFQEEAGMPATGRIDSGLVAALQEQAT